MPLSLRERLTLGERLLGAFIKTPSVHATEILGGVGFDFLVVDQEHGPFDAAALDMIALAGRASGTACLVRVADAAPAGLGGVLDLGFAGGYGAKTMAGHADDADRTVIVVAMIEDVEALDNLDEILATEGVDAILVGRADLAISLGETTVAAPAVTSAVDRVLAASRRHGVRAMIFAADVAEAARFTDRGVTGFIIASDQSLMRRSALEVRARFLTDISSGTR